MADEAWLQKKLTELYDEHRRLDDIIAQLTQEVSIDQLQIQRLKKRKLQLRDQIQMVESSLLPDIIA
ncbi:MAG: YdcH family protein [Holosporales bacterium]|jgi:hypothetical protein|nr:YdcH family protein [Thalassospira sp.]